MILYVLLNLDLIFSTYAGADNAKDMTPQTFNVVVNSACAVARRSMKNMI